MKIGNLATIDHNGKYELSEIVGFGKDRANGQTVTVKLCSTGEQLTLYPEELIIIADSL